MHVVGHQHLCMQRASEALCQFFHVVQIERAILVRIETGGPVITSLDEVQWNSGKDEAGGIVGSVCR